MCPDFEQPAHVAMRVLNACAAKQPVDLSDVETLRQILGLTTQAGEPDNLARMVMEAEFARATKEADHETAEILPVPPKC